MPPALAMCIALVGALFIAPLVGISYFQMKTRDPEKDGFFKLQKDLAEGIGLGGWASFQRSKGVRVASFVLAVFALLCFLAASAWFGYLTMISI